MEAVSIILKEGSLVGTRLDNSLFWYDNIVYKSEGRIVYIALIDKYPDDAVAPGRSISIKFVNEFFIYVFEGTVIKIDAAYPGYAAVRVTSAEEMINSRLSPRYDVNLPASLKPVWDSDSYPATMTDISFGGAAFLSAHRFDYNEELCAVIHLPEGNTVHAAGKVVRRNIRSTVTDYSLQFVELDENNCNILSRFFLHIEDEISLLHKKFISDVKGKL